MSTDLRAVDEQLLVHLRARAADESLSVIDRRNALWMLGKAERRLRGEVGEVKKRRNYGFTRSAR